MRPAYKRINWHTFLRCPYSISPNVQRKAPCQCSDMSLPTYTCMQCYKA